MVVDAFSKPLACATALAWSGQSEAGVKTARDDCAACCPVPATLSIREHLTLTLTTQRNHRRLTTRHMQTPSATQPTSSEIAATQPSLCADGCISCIILANFTRPLTRSTLGCTALARLCLGAFKSVCCHHWGGSSFCVGGADIGGAEVDEGGTLLHQSHGCSCSARNKAWVGRFLRCESLRGGRSC